MTNPAKYTEIKESLVRIRIALSGQNFALETTEAETSTRLRIESNQYLAEIVLWDHGALSVLLAESTTGKYIIEEELDISDGNNVAARMNEFLSYYGRSWEHFS